MYKTTVCALWYALNVNLKLCRVFSVVTVRQDILLKRHAEQVPAEARQTMIDPNGHFLLRQEVEVVGQQVSLQQLVVLKDHGDRQVSIHQNVQGYGPEHAQQNNNAERAHNHGIGAAGNEQDLRRPNARLPAPAAFLAHIYGPYPPRHWASRPNYSIGVITLAITSQCSYLNHFWNYSGLSPKTGNTRKTQLVFAGFLQRSFTTNITPAIKYLMSADLKSSAE